MTNKQVFVNKLSQLSTKEQSVGKTRMLTGAAMLSTVIYLLQFIEFIKNALQLTSTSTGGIGELANFVVGSVVSGLITFVTMFLYKPLSPILKGRI